MPRALAIRSSREVTPDNTVADDYWKRQSAQFTDVAQATLRAGRQCIRNYREFDPLVRDLVTEVRTRLARIRSAEEGADTDRATANFYLDTLTKSATILDKLSKSSQSFLRSSDALERLGIFMQGGRKDAPDARKMTEKQMAAVVIETCKRLRDERGVCPVCDAKDAIPVAATEVVS